LNCAILNGAQIKYKVSEIPANLLKDSKAVIRRNEIEFKISHIDKAVKKIIYAITILNENGLDNSLFIKSYNKFSTIRNIFVELYDQNGKQITNNANVRVKDYSAIAGYSIYEDSRVKYVDPGYRTTPFTVEYTYEIVYDGLLNYPDWHLLPDYNVSVEKSSLTVITPSGFNFRYKEHLINETCKVDKNPKETIYKWEVINLPSARKELFGLSLSENTPYVFLAPNDFEISGTKGNLETWESFGKWMYSLGKGRNTLPSETQSQIKSMVSGLDNDIDKIRILYAYFQNKVRYVSVQIGLGGWQTTDAETVDRLSYGDCKALSNYMKSLLDVVGIKSLYTLALAGEDAPSVVEGFPSNQFNHAILCVPLKADTIWLECTSQHIPFGFIGTFTDDRKVLVIDEKGGLLVRTKKYDLNENVQVRNASVSLGSSGYGKSTINTVYKGTKYDDISSVLMMDQEDKKRYIQKQITIPAYNLNSFSYKEERGILPSICEELDLDLSGLGTLTGNRLVFNPNIFTRFGKLPSRTQERKTPINIRRSYSEFDTVRFALPTNFKIDRLPEKRIIKNQFGEYSSEMHFEDNRLIYIRSLKLFEGLYLPKDYLSFVDFCEQISLADGNRISLVKI
jgi:hypothetical protein